MIKQYVTLDYRGEGNGASTPWGKAQHSYHLRRGVVFYSTAGHGGMKVSKRIAEKYMTEYSRENCIQRYGAYWFEEDCDINLPLYELSLNLPGFADKALEFSKSATKERLEEYIHEYFKDYPFEQKEA